MQCQDQSTEPWNTRPLLYPLRNGVITYLRSYCPNEYTVLYLGHSLNPGIDVGQIEGAFVMGMGMVTTEQLLRNHS